MNAASQDEQSQSSADVDSIPLARLCLSADDVARLNEMVSYLSAHGKPLEAETLSRLLTQLCPNDHRVWQKYLELAVSQRNWPTVIERAQAAMAHCQNKPVGIAVNYAIALIELTEFEKAECYLADLINTISEETPETWQLYFHYAVILTRQYSYKAALARFEKAYAKYPNIFPIRLSYAKSLLESDRNEQALSIFAAMLSDGVKHPGVCEGYAKSLLRVNTKDIESAIAALQQGKQLAGDAYTKKLYAGYLVGLKQRRHGNDRAIKLYQKLCDEYNMAEIAPFFGHSVKYGIRTVDPLADSQDHSWSKSGCQQLFDLISDALQKQQPFSLLRLGDGEGLVLSGHNKNLLHATDTVTSDSYDIEANELAQVLSQFHDAILNCNVLGLPLPGLVMVDEHWRNVVKFLPTGIYDKIAAGEMVATDWNCHHHLYWSNAIGKLLTDRDFCGYISNHQLDDAIKQYGVKNVDGYLIPGEAMYKLNLKNKPHYPDYFDHIIKSIDIPYKGALFLVGAGVLGKIYCNVIKQKGGCAIDIGAVMDYMVGKFDTRITYSRQANRGFLIAGESQ